MSPFTRLVANDSAGPQKSTTPEQLISAWNLTVNHYDLSSHMKPSEFSPWEINMDSLVAIIFGVMGTVLGIWTIVLMTRTNEGIDGVRIEFFQRETFFLAS